MKDLTEILDKFQNGERRYQEDEAFKNAIDSLAAGISPYAVLDSSLRRLASAAELLAQKTLEARALCLTLGELIKENEARKNQL
jgi:hypothetical protein